MPIVSKFTRWEAAEHHPSERCESTVANGQCPFLAVPETKTCPMHGANKSQQVLLEETRRAYRLRKWQDRIADFADDEQIISLREEIGILRMVMEEMLNKCEDSQDLLMMSHRIADTALKIERLITTCEKIERRTGAMLSKRSIIQLASRFVEIINNHVEDPDILEQISDEMVRATKELDVLLLEDSA